MESTDKAGDEADPLPGSMELPAPTPYPLLVALGLTLLGAGWVTNRLVILVGAIFGAVGAVGWTRTVFSSKAHVHVPMRPAPSVEPAAARVEVTREEAPRAETAEHRGLYPATMHPYSAGAKGGAVGGVFMVIVALIYGLVSGHGVWYPVNLLAGTVVPSLVSADLASLEAFNVWGLVVGSIMHVVLSVGLGLMYGILLPMLPGRPLVWGGLVAPLLWSGIIHSGMSILDPILASRVSWAWFIGSQMAYGIAAGIVVERTVRVPSAAVGNHPGGRQNDESSGEESSAAKPSGEESSAAKSSGEESSAAKPSGEESSGAKPSGEESSGDES